MESRKPYLATLPGLILGCLVCCALWGSAFPCIKIGYGSLVFPRTIAPHSCSLQVCALRLPDALVIVGMSVAQRRPLYSASSRYQAHLYLVALPDYRAVLLFLPGTLARQRHVEFHHRGQRQLPSNPLCRPGISHREARIRPKCLAVCWALPASRSSTFRAWTAPLALRSTARVLS